MVFKMSVLTEEADAVKNKFSIQCLAIAEHFVRFVEVYEQCVFAVSVSQVECTINLYNVHVLVVDNDAVAQICFGRVRGYLLSVRACIKANEIYCRVCCQIGRT